MLGAGEEVRLLQGKDSRIFPCVAFVAEGVALVVRSTNRENVKSWVPSTVLPILAFRVAHFVGQNSNPDTEEKAPGKERGQASLVTVSLKVAMDQQF